MISRGSFKPLSYCDSVKWYLQFFFAAVSLRESPGSAGFYLALSLGQSFPEQISQHTGSLMIFWAVLYVTTTWIRLCSIICVIKSPVADWFRPFSEDRRWVPDLLLCHWNQVSILNIFRLFSMGFIPERRCGRTVDMKKEFYLLPSNFCILCHG